MPSQSRALEASFEPSGKSPVPPGSDTAPALEDFDSFFEKLNSPDPLGWSSAHPSNPGRKAPAGTAANKPAGAAAKPSGQADPLAGLRAAFAQTQPSQPPGTAQASGQEPPPAKRRGISGAFRFAATALVLFMVGMGIGWAALSLPAKMSGDTATTVPVPAPGAGTAAEPKVALPASGRFDGSSPKRSAVFDGSSRERSESAQDGSSDRWASIVPLTEVTPGPDSRDAALLKPAAGESSSSNAAEKSGGSAAVDPAEKQIAQGNGAEALGSDGQTADAGGKPAEAAATGKTPDAAARNPSPPAGSRKLARKATPRATPVVTAAAAEAGPAPSRLFAPREEPSAVAPEPVQDSSPASSQAATGPRYAVQVGACRSARCIENYRALVAAHLPANADSIRVIPVPADPSGVQRVRVAPLEQSEAQQLRMALIQADPRLSNAYVVVAHP
jgi:hypothetical protein